MYFVREDFLSTVKKLVIEYKQVFGGTHAKDYSSSDFRGIVNLKLPLHLVHINKFQIISLKKNWELF